MKDYKNIPTQTQSKLKTACEVFFAAVIFSGFFVTAWVAMAVL